MVQQNLHLPYIKRCMDLARRAAGIVSPNPLVGAVVVYKGVIIGEGWHQKYGEAHAEVNAVTAVPSEKKHLLTAATLYVSLEPCFHYGKTPPCVDLVLKIGFPKVVVAMQDPHEKVAGQSIQKLRDSGVEVLVFKEGNSLVQSFCTNIQLSQPYILLKWAESKNKIIGNSEYRQIISNSYTQFIGHKLRSECDAILVGLNTVLIDNPRLDNRLYFGKSPIKVILDKKGILLANWEKWAIFQNSEVPTFVIVSEEKNLPLPDHIRQKVISNDTDFIQNLLKFLFEQKIGILLVEGGATTLQRFIDAEAWNEAFIFQSNTVLSEKNAIFAPKLPASDFKTLNLKDNQLLHCMSK